MSVIAVIDTNVLISALISKKMDTGVMRILYSIVTGSIIPLWHEDIIKEYDEVFHRKKFSISEQKITNTINLIMTRGRRVDPVETDEILIDSDDLIFWKVVMAERNNNAYLVTGNIKHYPKKDFVLTPSEMMNILMLQ